jgi:hypothetical protein
VFHSEQFDRLFMTMFAKYNSKINIPNIWLTSLILVCSFTLSDMNLEYIEGASENGLIQ